MEKSTVGLFGTCGNSTWRKDFINFYLKNNVSFFNPQLGVGEWNPDFANEYVRKEHFHLKNDDIIVFAITDETTADVSLSELGFSVNDVLRSSKNRYCIFFIDENCNAPDASEAQIKNSIKMRKTVIPKIKKLSEETDNVFLVNSIADLYALSLDLIYFLNTFNNLKRRYS